MSTPPIPETTPTEPPTAQKVELSYWQNVLLTILCGLLIALALPPLSLFPLALAGLAGLFWLVATQKSKRQSFLMMWWGMTTAMALHLWWLTVFVGNILGVPVLGILATLLYALEGSFYGLMALVVVWLFRHVAARLWGLALGWVVLEWLRTLGPLAFPWPTLGYSLIDTPVIQIADIGGVLLCSLLMVVTVVAMLHNVMIRYKSTVPQWLVLGLWVFAILYGNTRSNAEGPIQPMLTLRTTFDAFDKASQQLSSQQQLEIQRQVSTAGAPQQEQQDQKDQLLIWSESALSAYQQPQPLSTTFTDFPTAGITGLGIGIPSQNTVVSIDQDGTLVSMNRKARLVPFGEYFIFYDGILGPIYRLIERQIGFQLPTMLPAQDIAPLQLRGHLYGAYVCYDSVFPWVARKLVAKGAEVLINPSNDGWYAGWGVQQHFTMGRVRAIETRRWLVRSVNLGIAGAVDDLGKPIKLLESGDQTQALQVTPKLLSGQTVFVRFGDSVVFALLSLLLGLASFFEYRDRRDRKAHLCTKNL